MRKTVVIQLFSLKMKMNANEEKKQNCSTKYSQRIISDIRKTCPSIYGFQLCIYLHVRLKKDALRKSSKGYVYDSLVSLPLKSILCTS